MAWRAPGTTVLEGSRGAGRWNPSYLNVLYGAKEPDGAIAEVHFHLIQGQSIFPSLMRHVLHELRVVTDKTLILADLSQLVALGVDRERYQELLYGRTQEIAAAAAFLGFDGIIAPSVRWPSENIVLFLDVFGLDNIERVSESVID